MKNIQRTNSGYYRGAAVESSPIASTDKVEIVSFDITKIIPVGVPVVWVEVVDFYANGVKVKFAYGDKLQTTVELGDDPNVKANRDEFIAWLKTLNLAKIEADPNNATTRDYGKLVKSQYTGRQYMVKGYGTKPVHGKVTVGVEGFEDF